MERKTKREILQMEKSLKINDVLEELNGSGSIYVKLWMDNGFIYRKIWT